MREVARVKLHSLRVARRDMNAALFLQSRSSGRDKTLPGHPAPVGIVANVLLETRLATLQNGP